MNTGGGTPLKLLVPRHRSIDHPLSGWIWAGFEGTSLRSRRTRANVSHVGLKCARRWTIGSVAQAASAGGSARTATPASIGKEQEACQENADARLTYCTKIPTDRQVFSQVIAYISSGGNEGREVMPGTWKHRADERRHRLDPARCSEVGVSVLSAIARSPGPDRRPASP
jgi:hypothetical protein